jgi:hypothetical protein
MQLNSYIPVQIEDEFAQLNIMRPTSGAWEMISKVFLVNGLADFGHEKTGCFLYFFNNQHPGRYLPFPAYIPVQIEDEFAQLNIMRPTSGAWEMISIGGPGATGTNCLDFLRSLSCSVEGLIGHVATDASDSGRSIHCHNSI